MRKVVSIFLIFQILFASIGFASNAHYCKGKVVETSLSLGFEDIGCSMGMKHKECTSNVDAQNESLSKKCCDNEHHLLKVDQQIRLQLEDLQFKNFFVVFVHVFVAPAIGGDQNKFVFNTSSPPLFKSAFQILYQIFLI